MIILINNIEFELLKYNIKDMDFSGFNKIECEIDKKYIGLINIGEIDAILIDKKITSIIDCTIDTIFLRENVLFNIYFDHLSDTDVDINIIRKYKLRKII